MGGNVLKKLRSSKGASLTFALLAFLVCAVISAVLLASASAAAGRLSGLAEADQRYYAVTSAAQLFCDELSEDLKNGDNVVYYNIEWSKTETTSKKEIITIKSTEEGYVSNTYDRMSEAEGPSYVFSSSPNPMSSSASFLTKAAMYLAFGGKADTASSYGNDFAGLAFENEADFAAQRTFPKIWKFTIEESSNSKDYAGLKVDACATMSSDGHILIEFTNHQDAGSAPPFSVNVELVPSGFSGTIEESVNSWTTTVTSSDETYDSVMITTKKTTTRSVNIGWTIGSVTKVYNNGEDTPVTNDDGTTVTNGEGE